MCRFPPCSVPFMGWFFWFQEPYFRFNDLSYRWIAYDNWTYATIFSVSPELRWNCKLSRFHYYSEFDLNCLFCSKRAKEKILLVFDGVDTVSTIWLNGVKVGSTDNMFRRYVSPLRTTRPSGHLSASISWALFFPCRISKLETFWRLGKMCWKWSSCLRFFMHLRGLELIRPTEFLPSVLQTSRRGNVTSISLERSVCLMKQYFHQKEDG